jgi:hypothetical protein
MEDGASTILVQSAIWMLSGSRITTIVSSEAQGLSAS